MYQIVRVSPVHCGITDGIVGSQYNRLPYAYNTEAYARRRASQLSQSDYLDGGDDTFYVIKAGDPVMKRMATPVTIRDWSGDAEIPF